MKIMVKMYSESEVELERQKAALVSNFMNMRDEFIRKNRAGGYVWACDWALLQLGIKVEDADETKKTRR